MTLVNAIPLSSSFTFTVSCKAVTPERCTLNAHLKPLVPRQRCLLLIRIPPQNRSTITEIGVRWRCEVPAAAQPHALGDDGVEWVPDKVNEHVVVATEVPRHGQVCAHVHVALHQRNIVPRVVLAIQSCQPQVPVACEGARVHTCIHKAQSV